MKPARPHSPAASKKGKPHTGVTRYDPEFALLICERIATTPQSLVKICEAPDMPGVATIFRWAREHPDFQEMYVLAKETQAEVLIEEALDIVDDDSQDIIESADGKIVFNRIHLQRCKMQVEHRRWIAAKLLPRKYGTHQREKNAATKSSPPPERPAPDGVMTEEYRMQLIAARREKMDRDIAAAEAAAAAAAATQNSSPPAPPSTPAEPASPPTGPQSPTTPGLHSPNPEPQSAASHLRIQPPEPRTPSWEIPPTPPPPPTPSSGHNPRRMYDVPRPRRPMSTINKACS